MKPIEEMTFDELVEWAQGYILLELIKGNFHIAIFHVCEVTARWRQSQDKKKKK
jgi:hypothetical protein